MDKKEKKKSGLMTQLNKLSKRELVLIYILLLVAIVAGGFVLLIKPAVEAHDTVSLELDEIEQRQYEVDTLIGQIPSFETQIKDTKKNIKKVKKQFNEIKTNEELDRLITGMIVSSGLRPVSLQVGASSQELQALEDQSGEQTTESTDSGTQTDTSSDSPADSAGDSPAADSGSAAESGQAQVADTVVLTVVSASVSGTMNEFASLIGRAANQKGVQIQSFNVSGQENEDSSSAAAAAILEESGSKSSDTKASEAYTAQVVFVVYQSDQV